MKALVYCTTLLLAPMTAAAQVELNEESLNVLTEAVSQLRASQVSPDERTDADAKQQRIAEAAGAIMELGVHALVPIARKAEELSPDTWRTMVRRQYTKGAQRMVFPAGMLLFGFWLWGLCGGMRRRVTMMTGKDQDVGSIVQGVTGLVVGYGLPIMLIYDFLSRFLTQLSGTVGYFTNPEYYALQDLLIAVLSKGAGS